MPSVSPISRLLRKGGVRIATRKMVNRRTGEVEEMLIEEGDTRTPEQIEAARGRFSEPFISYLWHADGSPFTHEEYRERGIAPPAPGEQKELIVMD